MDRQMDSRLSRRLGPPTKWAAKSTGPETGEARPWSSVCLFSGVDFQPAGGRGHCRPGLAAAPSVRSSPCSLSPGPCSSGPGRGWRCTSCADPAGTLPAPGCAVRLPWLPCLSPPPPSASPTHCPVFTLQSPAPQRPRRAPGDASEGVGAAPQTRLSSPHPDTCKPARSTRQAAAAPAFASTSSDAQAPHGNPSVHLGHKVNLGPRAPTPGGLAGTRASVGGS